MCTRLFPKKSRVFEEALVCRFFLELVHALMCACGCSVIVKVGKPENEILKPGLFPAVSTGVFSEVGKPTKSRYKNSSEVGICRLHIRTENPCFKGKLRRIRWRVRSDRRQPERVAGFRSRFHSPGCAGRRRGGGCERRAVSAGSCYSLPKSEAIKCGGLV